MDLDLDLDFIYLPRPLPFTGSGRESFLLGESRIWTVRVEIIKRKKYNWNSELLMIAWKLESVNPRRASAEPPHPQTEQEHDRDGTSLQPHRRRG